MSIKLIAFDVDGTLYDPKEHRIPESCIKGIHLLKQNGILFCIATGRAHYGLGKALNDLHADYILAANGGVVVDNKGRILSHEDISQQECEQLISFAHRHEAGLVFKFPKHMYIYQHPEKIDWLDGQIHSDIGRDPFIFHTKQNHHLMELPQCASLHADPAEVRKFAEKSTLSFKQYSADGFDVAPKNVSKGAGLTVLMNHLGLLKEETACFGDNYNDIEMMHVAGYRIAMGNAVAEVKEIADYVTDAVDRNGIYNGLKHLHVI